MRREPAPRFRGRSASAKTVFAAGKQKTLIVFPSIFKGALHRTAAQQPEQFRHPFHNGTQKRTDTRGSVGVCSSRKRVPPINGVYLSSSANQQSIFAISVRTAVPPGLRFVLPRPPFRPAPTVHRIASFALGGNAAAVRERTQISALVSHPL